MDERLKEIAKVEFSGDFMSARLYLSSTPLEVGKDLTSLFTLENVTEFLSDQGVKAGIDSALLQSIVIDRLYDQYHVIAKGTPAIDGKDGFYTFKFNTQVNNKPILNPDGSVDYHNIDVYEPVSEGDEIATYTHPIPGHFGYNVKGEIITCKQPKQPVQLKGNGFRVSEDGVHYYSELNGKIELKNGEVNITNVLDIPGDVSPNTGYIEFNGDVFIHGNVISGSKINVGGNLSIMGSVENVEIHAGGDIELKSGMQGGGIGTITCSGNVWGKFFEQVTLNVQGDIHANSLLNCETNCEGNVSVTGRHGMIVGGSTTTSGSIEATVIGNMAEVRTNVNAGISKHNYAEIKRIEGLIIDNDSKIEKLFTILDKLNHIEHPTDQEKYDIMLEEATNSLNEYRSIGTMLESELNQKLFLMSTYTQSKIVVQKYLYPGVYVNLCGIHYISKDTFVNVTLKSANSEIQLIDNLM